MARPLRIEYAGAWYHVMNRGLCRREVFHAEEYAQMFYELLEEAHDRYRFEVHAYCLMGNHYHLCVRTPNANLGNAMRHINSGFTRKYNRIINGDGPLFRGRYKAILVERQNYFLQLCRYIHLNPVSAGIVEHPKDYLWSSYQFLRGKATKPNWLYLNEIFKSFENVDPIYAYEKFVLEGVDSEVKSFFNRKNRIPIIGSDGFIKEMKQKIKERKQDNEIPEIDRMINYPLVRISEIVDSVAKYYNVAPDSIYIANFLENKPKKIAIFLAVQMSGKTQSMIARYFDNISYHWVSKVYIKIKSQSKKDPLLSRDIYNIKKMLEPKPAIRKIITNFNV